MASRTLSFPPRPAAQTAAAELPLPPESPSPEPTAATPFLPSPASPHRYRGLHLVGEAAIPTLHIAAPRPDSATRARSIVAQVQWEIEQKASRQRSASLRPQRVVGAPALASEPAFHRETPLVVFRRVARSLGLISRR